MNIPIQSGDDDAASPTSATVDEDDVFEIDADALDADDEIGDDVTLTDEAEDRDGPVEDADVADPVAATPPTGHPEAKAAASGAQSKAQPAQSEARPEAKSEFSREAVFDLMTELRQKSEAVDRLTNEKNDLYDKLIRKQAEFENFRKRTEREVGESYSRARADVLTDLLPVLDNFELALMHADAASAEAILEGVQLIFKQLSDTLSRFGLEPVAANNLPFDPEIHEAVATEPSDDVPDHTVVAVMQRGYKLGDRLLRPARVKVAVQP